MVEENFGTVKKRLKGVKMAGGKSSGTSAARCCQSDLQDDQGVLHGEVVRRQPLTLPDELLTLRAQEGAQVELCRATKKKKTPAREQTLASQLLNVRKPRQFQKSFIFHFLSLTLNALYQ